MKTIETTIFKTKNGIYPISNFGTISHANVLKNGSLEIWNQGVGYSKVKKFETFKITLSFSYDNVKDIINCYKQYGEHVAYLMITNNAIYWRKHKMNSIKWIMNNCILEQLNDCSDQFLNIIDCEWNCSWFSFNVLDIFELDKKISKIDSLYNHELATYNNEPCSMKEAILKIFGVKEVKLIETLLT